MPLYTINHSQFAWNYHIYRLLYRTSRSVRYFNQYVPSKFIFLMNISDHEWNKLVNIVCRNTRPFLKIDNKKRLIYAEKNGLPNCNLGFLKFRKFWNFWDFCQNFCFIFAKKSPKFKKKQNICTRRASKECMYQVSSNYLHKRCFYCILNVKNGYFSGHLDVIPCNSIYLFHCDFYATNDVLRSFFAF